MCCTRLAENTRRKNRQKFAIWNHRKNVSGCIFATTACIDNRKKLVKQQYLLRNTSQYGELRPISGSDRYTSLGHPSKFQRVSRVGFVAAPMSLTGRQPNFARCLAVSWAGTLCTFSFGGSCPLTEFCQMQDSLAYWQRYYTAIEKWA